MGGSPVHSSLSVSVSGSRVSEWAGDRAMSTTGVRESVTRPSPREDLEAVSVGSSRRGTLSTLAPDKYDRTTRPPVDPSVYVGTSV